MKPAATGYAEWWSRWPAIAAGRKPPPAVADQSGEAPTSGRPRCRRVSPRGGRSARGERETFDSDRSGSWLFDDHALGGDRNRRRSTSTGRTSLVSARRGVTDGRMQTASSVVRSVRSTAELGDGASSGGTSRRRRRSGTASRTSSTRFGGDRRRPIRRSRRRYGGDVRGGLRQVLRLRGVRDRNAPRRYELERYAAD